MSKISRRDMINPKNGPKIFTDSEGNRYQLVPVQQTDKQLLTLKPLVEDKQTYFLMMGCDWIGNSDILKLRRYDLTPEQAAKISEAIEARCGGFDKPSDTASVGGNQVADPILVSELFRMVYQWGRVGIVVDSTCPAFQEQLREVMEDLK